MFFVESGKDLRSRTCRGRNNWKFERAFVRQAISIDMVTNILSSREFLEEEIDSSFEDLLSDLWGESIQDAVLRNTDHVA
jgi:hypothetical protein